jgi:hypothetical protein
MAAGMKILPPMFFSGTALNTLAARAAIDAFDWRVRLPSEG